MKWSQEAWVAAEPVYEQILKLAFIQELAAGTLDRAKFMFYIEQDASYLIDYGKVLAGIAAKLDRLDHRQAFVSFANDCMFVERDMHESYLGHEIKATDIRPTPSCLLYKSYLLKTLYEAPVSVAMAAVLPCFWVYQGVGRHILQHQNKENNPYQAWINMYGGKEFDAAVSLAIGICDEVASQCTEEQRRAMVRAYVMCTKLEWMFWDSAWRLEGWLV
ncbi:MAG: thiaminase II [Polyangiaceae bacterium]|nr:thiaminase II [Polyangiaceae bacterium]